VGFSVNPVIGRLGRSVVLVEDIYQSGTTVNFLRSKLTAANVQEAYCLSIVKADGDRDNLR
jgi:predicted amidophosphoribosyltransferase